MSRYQWVFAMRRSPDLQRLLIFGLSGPFLALNLWILSQVILYFQHLITVLVIAAILAFLLNYPVRIIERFYRSRSQAVIVVLLFTLALLVVLGFTLVPIVINQTTELLKNIPAWLDASNDNLTRLTDWTRDRRLPIDFRAISKSVNARIESQLQVLATQVLGFALGTLTGLLDTILVIVLAFYMLLYGKKLWLGIVSLLPPQIGLPLSESLRLNFQNFFISQILLALFMFGTLTPIFLIMGVQFALLFALLIGMAEVIPFIGATLGIGLVTILLMLNSFWLAMRVAIAAIIMQQIKDNLLAPRLMGEFIGLNPILIFIALLVGAQLAGVLGVIIAVPIAGTIKGTIDAIRLLRQTQAIATEPVSAEPSNPVCPEEGYEKEKS
ncbi:MAG TPA: AI-2E family transporter [Coleofasciculaceae cyanobacterium]|jgi:predicted PurR-regulated permease PerM